MIINWLTDMNIWVIYIYLLFNCSIDSICFIWDAMNYFYFSLAELGLDSWSDIIALNWFFNWIIYPWSWEIRDSNEPSFKLFSKIDPSPCKTNDRLDLCDLLVDDTFSDNLKSVTIVLSLFWSWWKG